MLALPSEFDIDFFQFREVLSDEFAALFSVVKYEMVVERIGIVFFHADVHVTIPIMSVL
jgi:hypothetical protein